MGNYDIVIEKLYKEAIIPEHADGSQHDNIGLDLFAGKFYRHFVPMVEGEDSFLWVADVGTGVRLGLPRGVHMQVASRSGLAFNDNILAFPGVIDSSYRGEVKVRLYAVSPTQPDSIIPGQKIAQGLILRSLDYTITEGTVDQNTVRGDAGFGSTG